jgi:hypothetical protein
VAGLAYAYGDSADVNGGWVALDRLVAEYWDPDTDPQDARRFYLNQITHASDSWLSQPELTAVADSTKVVADRDVIVLGFDGSRKRSQGVTDATALIGCRVSDGHLFEVGIWEQPTGPAGDDWQIPVAEVEAAVTSAFRRWRVVGMFADPSMWDGHLAQWEARYAAQLQVKASRSNPMHWWMNRPTAVVAAVAQLHQAITQQECTYSGESALTRHMLNARRRSSRAGIVLAKEHPDSARKIDAAYAAVLAWQARLAAVAAGISTGQKRVARRIY